MECSFSSNVVVDSMAKKYLITISDDYINDIEDFTDIHIDDEGIVWYLFSYNGGKISEWEPDGVVEEVK